MKDKERLSMYVDITRITITLCWIALIAFWCLKLFGGNWFEIMVENENFIKFSDLVQNTWLKYLVSLFTICISNYMILGAIAQKFLFKSKQLIIVILCLVSMWAVSNFVPIEFIKMYYGYIVILVFSLVVQKGWRKLYGLISIVLEFLFVGISMVTRNISLNFINDYLVLLVLMIDVYIMIALYYLYSNLIKIERENNMALLLGHGWLSKESAQIKGYNSWRRFWHNVGYALSFKWAKKK